MNTATDIAAIRAAEIAKMRENAEAHRAALATAREDLWLVYTGNEDAPVWINFPAVREGRWSISLKGATRFARRAQAENHALHVTNGKGQRGNVCSEAQAHRFEIAALERAIRLIERAAAQTA